MDIKLATTNMINYLIKIRNSWNGWCETGNAYLNKDDYGPTEAWAVTLAPIVVDLPTKPSYAFTRDMRYGQTSEDVKNLQIYLKYLGFFDYPTITGYFGGVTQDAVYKFQLAKVPMSFIEKYVYRGYYVGSKTRAVLNAL